MTRDRSRNRGKVRLVESIVALFLLVGCGGIHPEVNETPPEALESSARKTVVEAPIDERMEWTLAAKYENNKPIKDLEGQCSGAAVKVVKQAGITGVTKCRVQHFQHGDRSLYLVRLNYGPAQDCPSGCFQDKMSGVVSDTDVRAAKIPNVRSGTAAGHVRPALASILPDLGIKNASRYQWYDEKRGFPCGNDRKPKLVSKGDALWWEFDLSDTMRCVPRIPGPNMKPLAIVAEISGRIVLRFLPADTGGTDLTETRVEVIQTP